MSLRLRILIFLIILIWTLGIFIEFILPHNSRLILIIPWLHKTYSLVCHQESRKLISVAHQHSLVCSRCAGIYTGALFTSFIFIFVKLKNSLKLKYLIYASIPMVLDVIFYSIGIYKYSKMIAFLTGLLLGSVGFLYIHEGILNLINEKLLKRKNI